jgi:hypothetical protein
VLDRPQEQDLFPKARTAGKPSMACLASISAGDQKPNRLSLFYEHREGSQNPVQTLTPVVAADKKQDTFLRSNTQSSPLRAKQFLAATRMKAPQIHAVREDPDPLCPWAIGIYQIAARLLRWHDHVRRPAQSSALVPEQEAMPQRKEQSYAVPATPCVTK